MVFLCFNYIFLILFLLFLILNPPTIILLFDTVVVFNFSNSFSNSKVKPSTSRDRTTNTID